jgi:diguanylate cyclase (GGDEF)-like protein/PAS domain S-box-containing protein
VERHLGRRSPDDQLRAVLGLLDEGVLEIDAQSRVLAANASALRILGLQRSALDGERWWEPLRPRHDDGTVPAMPAFLHRDAHDVVIHIRRASDGEPRTLLVRHRAMDDLGGVLTFRDSTDERVTRERLEAVALRDGLTGLPNRAAALAALVSAVAAGEPFALLLVDIDGFRTVNTGLGQDAGDAVLREIAGRLRGVLPRTALAARFGADDFLVLAAADDEAAARAVAERIGDAFVAPFATGQGATLSASVGIAQAGAARDAAGMVAAAEAALTHAQARGRGLVELFDDTLRRATEERTELVVELRGAIERDEIGVAYQPIVGMDGDAPRLVGVEALARWRHPRRGDVPPALFIALAEETGLVRALGRRVLARACKEVVALRAASPGLELSVNVSARQVASGLLEHDVRAALTASGLEPTALSLELTETALMDDAGPRLDALDALRRIGVRLIIDDFGTGYSSLARLQRLPLDGLKIDRSFVAGLGSAPIDQAIVEAVLTMAGALRLPVVAEGVETRAQSLALRALGCARAQGFLHGRPMRLAEMHHRLARGPRDLPAARANG